MREEGGRSSHHGGVGVAAKAAKAGAAKAEAVSAMWRVVRNGLVQLVKV